MPDVLRVGVDVGSTTIKIVILDEKNTVVFREYLRHFSDVKNTLHSMFANAQHVLQRKLTSIVFTGSSGISISKHLDIPFIQEVIACSRAVRHIIPQTDTVIELGGEDAKITYFGSHVEQRMNGVCAGGTGAFIDHMASLMNTDPLGLNELAKQSTTLYPIASRCGVFAKTDVQTLLNEGVARTDVAASILQAIVNQTISGLAQGRPISGKVALLGGPLHFLSELRKRFIVTLKLHDDQVITPDSSQYFVALGAALANKETPVPFEHLHRMDSAMASAREKLVPLFCDEEAYRLFQDRHAKNSVARGSLEHYSGKAYLGIDAGSTTTKLALVGEDGSLLHSYYASNAGQPLDTAVAALAELYSKINGCTQIIHSTVTGYGERLIKAALRVDSGEIETVAHFTAARHFLPEVDFVLDIGGQDMKSFFVHDGVIDSIMLNEACSAGCGSFIENFAQSLGMTVTEFAALGIKAKSPEDFGTRCTVFMNSKVKEAQKEGAALTDISAGIAFSVIKNALFKVIRIKSADDLGRHIVVQGGTFHNDVVLRAMEATIGKLVVRPDIAGIMGAYGAALIARDRGEAQEATTLLRAAEINSFVAETSIHRCAACNNHCLVTAKQFSSSSEKYFSGNRCERGEGRDLGASSAPNLYAYKYNRLFGYIPLQDSVASRGTIGIPRVMNMYEDYPFWFTFFTALGYRVVLSAHSSRKLYETGMETIPSDSICYPAKLAHGHIADLVFNKKVKKIFYPCIPFNTPEDPTADHHYNCPVVTSYPESIDANMDIIRDESIAFFHPFLPLDNPRRMQRRLQDELASESISPRSIASAVKLAYAELERYKTDVKRKGEEALEYIRAHHKKAIVLAGRPYHIDPEINHGIAEMLQSYDFTVLSEDAVCHLATVKRPLRVVDQWMYHSRLYAAATWVAEQPDVEMIQLNSFGCGLDAVTIDQTKELLAPFRKIHTVVKLDEISNLGAARIRIRSLIAALAERDKRLERPPSLVATYDRVLFSRKMKNTHTILAPELSPVHVQFIQAALRKDGYQVIIPPLPDKMAIDEGLKYVNNDACYPTIIVVGQIMKALKSGEYDLHNTSVLMPQTGGGCRATNYIAILRKALKDAGMPHVPVISMSAGLENNPGFSWSLTLLDGFIMSCIYGDLLMRVLLRTRPYEKTPGSADRLYAAWSEKIKCSLSKGNRRSHKDNINAIVNDFDNLELHENQIKPRVGIVGEILVKYHPTANNNLIELLEHEGGEAVVPDFTDFFLYCAMDHKVQYETLAGSYAGMLKGSLFIKIIDIYRREMIKALTVSKRFTPPVSIHQVAHHAEKYISLCNFTGEGWLLTGEMVELIHSGVSNILCLQPFGCLPNHIAGKGMIKKLRRWHPEANIVPIDYDPGASEVNQLNRIKLMLSVAREKIGVQPFYSSIVSTISASMLVMA